MVTAKVFQSGNSQAVRIPNEYHTEQKEFYVRKVGECLFLMPADDPWYLLRSSLGQAADELDIEREQTELSALPQREEF